MVIQNDASWSIRSHASDLEISPNETKKIVAEVFADKKVSPQEAKTLQDILAQEGLQLARADRQLLSKLHVAGLRRFSYLDSLGAKRTRLSDIPWQDHLDTGERAKLHPKHMRTDPSGTVHASLTSNGTIFDFRVGAAPQPAQYQVTANGRTHTKQLQRHEASSLIKIIGRAMRNTPRSAPEFTHLENMARNLQSHFQWDASFGGDVHYQRYRSGISKFAKQVARTKTPDHREHYRGITVHLHGKVTPQSITNLHAALDQFSDTDRAQLPNPISIVIIDREKTETDYMRKHGLKAFHYNGAGIESDRVIAIWDDCLTIDVIRHELGHARDHMLDICHNEDYYGLHTHYESHVKSTPKHLRHTVVASGYMARSIAEWTTEIHRIMGHDGPTIPHNLTSGSVRASDIARTDPVMWLVMKKYQAMAASKHPNPTLALTHSSFHAARELVRRRKHEGGSAWRVNTDQTALQEWARYQANDTAEQDAKHALTLNENEQHNGAVKFYQQAFVTTPTLQHTAHGEEFTFALYDSDIAPIKQLSILRSCAKSWQDMSSPLLIAAAENASHCKDDDLYETILTELKTRTDEITDNQHYQSIAQTLLDKARRHEAAEWYAIGARHNPTDTDMLVGYILHAKQEDARPLIQAMRKLIAMARRYKVTELHYYEVADVLDDIAHDFTGKEGRALKRLQAQWHKLKHRIMHRAG